LAKNKDEIIKKIELIEFSFAKILKLHPYFYINRNNLVLKIMLSLNDFHNFPNEFYNLRVVLNVL